MQYYTKSAIYSWLVSIITLKSLSSGIYIQYMTYQMPALHDSCSFIINILYIYIYVTVTSVNDTTSVLVGHPDNTTDISITATIGENVTLACSRISAWKRWTSDMNEITKNSSHNINIKGDTSGYYNLTITSFQSSNTGMYTCGVTVQTNKTTINNMFTADTASIVNYTVGKF